MCHSNGVSAVHPSIRPSHFLLLQFDFVELLDGRRLLAQDAHGLEGPMVMQRSLVPITTHNTGFIQYMDSGIWHLAIYNDGKEIETVSFITTPIGECHGRDTRGKLMTAMPDFQNKTAQRSTHKRRRG